MDIDNSELIILDLDELRTPLNPVHSELRTEYDQPQAGVSNETIEHRKRKCSPTDRMRSCVRKCFTKQELYHLGGCVLLVLVAMAICGVYILYQGNLLFISLVV